MKRRLLIGIPVGIVLVTGAVVAVTGIRAASYPGYWRELAQRDAPADAVRVVALGDSAMVAVGALDPENGIAGRVAADIAATGRQPHLANRAEGGATVADILRRQLREAEVARADLVIVQTSNDLERSVPLAEYRSTLGDLLGRLPAGRTVLGDLPPLPGRAPYARVLAEVAAEHGVAVAPTASTLRDQRRLDIFSALPPHLNDRGYGYWASAFLPETRRIIREHAPR